MNYENRDHHGRQRGARPGMRTRAAGSRPLVACRARRARYRPAAPTPSPRLGEPARCTVLEIDLASLRSVRDFVTESGATELPPLHALVCNAGVQVVSGTERHRRRGRDDVRRQPPWPFRAWCRGARPAGRARRASSSSAAAHTIRPSTPACPPRSTPPRPDLAHPDGRHAGRQAAAAYTTSKLCNVLFTYELDRRLGHGAQGVTVTAFDPGLMPGSGLARDYPPLHRLAWRYLLPALRVLPGVRSTRASGRYLAALADDARFDGVTGEYFAGGSRSGRRSTPTTATRRSTSGRPASSLVEQASLSISVRTIAAAKPAVGPTQHEHSGPAGAPLRARRPRASRGSVAPAPDRATRRAAPAPRPAPPACRAPPRVVRLAAAAGWHRRRGTPERFAPKTTEFSRPAVRAFAVEEAYHRPRYGWRKSDDDHQDRHRQDGGAEDQRHPARWQVGALAHRGLNLLPAPDRQYRKRAASQWSAAIPRPWRTPGMPNAGTSWTTATPPAINASEVRIQARNVRSLASVKR